MKTEPRRKDRAMKSTEQMEILLERMPVGRLAVTTGDGPYLVAVNYLYRYGSIYFHSGKEGRKIDALRDDPRVCFLVDDVGPRVLWDQGCGISQIYESVICFGKAEFVEEATEMRRILEKIVHKFVQGTHPLPSMTDTSIEKTAVIKIVIESMSGKANALSSSHTIIPDFA